jgi:RNA polymerase sigma-70 factor (ECF subfamily)
MYYIGLGDTFWRYSTTNYNRDEAISSPPDETLVYRAQEGDRQALEQLYQRYFPRVYNRIRALVPAEEVEDLTSEVFLSLVSSLKQFRAKSAFSTWLHTIIKRKVADYYRSRANKGEVDELSPERLESPANNVASEEERIMVREMLRQLPEHYCEVLLLRVDIFKW